MENIFMNFSISCLKAYVKWWVISEINKGPSDYFMNYSRLTNKVDNIASSRLLARFQPRKLEPPPKPSFEIVTHQQTEE
jgi:hypothetical protein